MSCLISDPAVDGSFHVWLKLKKGVSKPESWPQKLLKLENRELNQRAKRDFITPNTAGASLHFVGGDDLHLVTKTRDHQQRVMAYVHGIEDAIEGGLGELTLFEAIDGIHATSWA